MIRFYLNYVSLIVSQHFENVLSNAIEMEMEHNILYVDENPENLRAFKSVFRKIYEVITAKSASEGLEYLKTHEVHVVITELRMSEMSGLDLIDKSLKIPDKRAPSFIILSGYSIPEENESSFSHNLNRRYLFVSKPWHPENLKAKIDQSIDAFLNENQ